GKVLLPGMINCHTHTAETMYRGRGHDFEFPDWMNNLVYPTNEVMEAEGDELFYYLAQLSAMEAVASGTTSFIDNCVNFTKRHVYHTAKAMDDMGFRGAVAKDAVDQSPMDRGFTGPIDEEVSAVREFLGRWKAEGSDLVQAWVGPNGTAKKPNGGATDELLHKLKAVADEYNTRLHVHLAGTHWEIENVRKQTGLVGSIAMAHQLGILDERTSLAHCIWLDRSEMEILAETGTQAVHCPSCNQICAIGVFPMVGLMELGVTCAIGTDGAPQNDSLDMFREMRSAVLLQRITHMDADAVSHKDAFRQATEYGAKVLGVENLGKIEPGYLADLTAIQVRNNPFLMPMYDPLETIIYACSGGRDVAMTMVNGRILYEKGEFRTVDPVKVMSEVEAASKRIDNKYLHTL
nr:amidohydrolase family protein [Anaerolineae bacterium]NIO00315.1 amidohydrolase family protein [Anaerolineae bacterium]NIQ83090.1 amidohydrolase family protein [Anaerolineae bacterium]